MLPLPSFVIFNCSKCYALHELRRLSQLASSEHATGASAGHSLGSGAATAGLLAQAIYFEEKYNADIYAVLFGSPRGGTKKYVDALEAQVWLAVRCHVRVHWWCWYLQLGQRHQ